MVRLVSEYLLRIGNAPMWCMGAARVRDAALRGCAPYPAIYAQTIPEPRVYPIRVFSC